MAGSTARFAVLCLIVGCFMLPATAGAATVWNVSHVAGDGNYTGLQDIPKIGKGDTIRIWGVEGEPYEGGITIITSGVTIKRWEGSPARPIITNTLHTAPAITVTAGGITLQGLNISGNSLDSGNGAGVQVRGNRYVQLPGFTVTDCAFTGNEAAGGNGGAVSLEYVDDSRIADTTFTNNTATGEGGGACFNRSTGATLTDTTFTNNTATDGGGTHFFWSDTATLTETTFTGNTATDGGGACFSYSHDAALADTTFTNNTADRWGGGAYFARSDDAALVSTAFMDNTAGMRGGGAYFLWSADATLTDTTFAGNTAGKMGGGADFYNSAGATLAGATVAGNMAGEMGGGMCIYGSANATLVDATFTDNTADNGGGVWFLSAANATLTDSTFTNNMATAGGGTYFGSSPGAALMDTTFTNNTATKNGGGACIYGSSGTTLTNTTFTNNRADQWGGGACFFDFTGAAITNCRFDNPTNIYAVRSGAVLNATRSTGANIAGGPYLAGNLWLTDPARNISEWGADADLDGICDEAFTISNDDGSPFGTDHLPLIYGGTAVVNSAPAGASIHLDGVELARTTNTSLYLPAGDHDLTVTLDGYVTPENRTVTIPAGQAIPVSFALAPVCGSLAVSSVPEGARIILDGTATDNTTNTTLAEVLPGSHTVTVTFDGYMTPDNQTVTVVANETTAVSFTLDPAPAPAPRPHGSGGGRSHVSAAAAGNTPAGGHASFAVQDTAIHAVTVTAGEPIPAILITAETTGLPSGTDAPAGTVYEYVELTLYRTTDAALAGATLNFTVPKAWLAEKSFAPENVALYRYHNSTWQPLPTEIAGEDAAGYSFTAESPGFSLFAIAAAGGAIVADEPAARLTASPAPTAAADETPAPQQSPASWGLAVLAAGTAYLLKKRHR